MTRKLASGTLRTLVVHSRYAWRSHRTQAAIDGEQGLLIVTLEQLVARLAGGFLQAITSDDLKDAAIASSLSQIVTSPRLLRTRSYSLQFRILYFVLSWRLIRLDFPAAMTLPP